VGAGRLLEYWAPFPDFRDPMALPCDIHAFWQAYSASEAEFTSLASAEHVERGNELLARHVDGLGLEVQKASAGGAIDLIVTAHGDIAKFPLVGQLVAAAPPLKFHRVRAFRERDLQPEFSIKMGDFELATSDLLVSCGDDGGRVALEVRFDREIPHDLQDHARHMAHLMLDHVLGEYDFAVKVGTVDFVDDVRDLEATWVPLSALAPLFDSYWRDVLRHTGDFPDGEHEWSGLTLKYKDSDETAVVTLNLSAHAVAMRADLVHALTLDLPVFDRDSLSAAHAVQDQVATVLELPRLGILAHVLMRGGRRLAVYYVGDPVQAREAVAPLLAREGVAGDAVSVDFDPSWSRYYEFAVHTG